MHQYNKSLYWALPDNLVLMHEDLWIFSWFGFTFSNNKIYTYRKTEWLLIALIFCSVT